MLKKVVALLATATLSLGIVGFTAIPATATPPDGSGYLASLVADSVTCEEDGTFTIVWVGDTADVPDGVTATVDVKSWTPPGSSLDVSTGIPVANNGGYTIIQTGIPGTTQQANINVDVTFSDGYKVSDTTGHEGLGGGCLPPVVELTPLTASATAQAGACDENPTFTFGVNEEVPADAVSWTVDGDPKVAGVPYEGVGGAVVHIVGTAAEGYEFPASANTQQVVIDLQLPAVVPCTVPEEPVEPGDQLAATGFSPTSAVAFAGFVSLLGLALFRTGRRLEARRS